MVSKQQNKSLNQQNKTQNYHKEFQKTEPKQKVKKGFKNVEDSFIHFQCVKHD